MNLSIDDQLQAGDIAAAAEPTKPRRQRRPRVSAVELENAAFHRGYEAAREAAGDYSGLMVLGVGVLVGAIGMGTLWTLVHLLG